MKGKKNDADFVSAFIEKCIKNNILSSDEMLSLAKDQINQIDLKIKKVEDLKILRSKLIDVVSSFDTDKKNNFNQQKLLLFYKIKYHDLAGLICSNLNANLSLTENINNKENANFTIKQLIELSIINCDNYSTQLFSKGSLYEEYMSIFHNI